MRRLTLPLLIVLAALAACKQEPDFDQRFDQTRQKIDARAAAIDRELDAAASDAAVAHAGEPTGDQPCESAPDKAANR